MVYNGENGTQNCQYCAETVNFTTKNGHLVVNLTVTYIFSGFQPKNLGSGNSTIDKIITLPGLAVFVLWNFVLVEKLAVIVIPLTVPKQLIVIQVSDYMHFVAGPLLLCDDFEVLDDQKSQTDALELKYHNLIYISKRFYGKISEKTNLVEFKFNFSILLFCLYTDIIACISV